MPQDLEITKRFDRIYRKKTSQEKARIQKTLAMLAENPRHPGLQVHRVLGTRGIWECYVDDSSRITFEHSSESVLILRNNCRHDAVLRRP